MALQLLHLAVQYNMIATVAGMEAPILDPISGGYAIKVILPDDPVDLDGYAATGAFFGR